MVKYSYQLCFMFLLFFCTVKGNTQSNKFYDSSMARLKYSKDDQVKVDRLNSLSKELRQTSALVYARKSATDAFILAQKLNYKNGIAGSLISLGNVFETEANYDEALKNYNESFRIAEESGNKKRLVESYNCIGTISWIRGNYPDALKNYQLALKIAEEIRDKKNIGDSYNNIGNVYWKQRNQAEAMKNYNIALKIRLENPDKRSLGESYNNIGNIYYAQHNYTEALKNHTTSLKLREETGDKLGVAKSYNNIGNIYYMQGINADALKNYLVSLKLRQELGDKQGIASVSNNIGGIFFRQGNYADALKNYFSSLKAKEEIGDIPGIGNSYHSIATAYLEQGNYPEALKNFISSLKIRETIGDKQALADTYNNIGIVFERQGDYEGALKNYKASLKMCQDIGEKKTEGGGFINIGVIYQRQGNYPEALKNFLSALKIGEEINDKYNISSSYSNIAQIKALQGDWAEALKYYDLAVKIKVETGDQEGLANTFYNIGSTRIKMAAAEPAQRSMHLAQSRKYLDSALIISKQIGARDLIRFAYNGLSDLDSALGNYKQSLENYKFYAVYKDSVLNDENNKQIAEMRTKYETEKKDNEILLLNKEKFITDLTLKEQLAEISRQQLLQRQKENEILLLNQDKEIQQLEFGKKESELKEQKLQTESKNKEVQLLNKDKEIQKATLSIQSVEIRRQKNVRNSFIGGFAVLMLFSAVVFAQKKKITKEKNRSEELLLNILPSETARELKQTGGARAKSYDMVTVLFTDFKNFTQATEKMTAEELVKEIHFCYSEFDKIISQHGIEKIKTIGDSYMCAGGLPAVNSTNPVDMVKAAQKINSFMDQRKITLRDSASQRNGFDLRIGIHTGPVVAGIVGIKKFAYDIWGDTVNIASRMESSGETGKINISGATYELIKKDFTCTYRGKIQAKNKGEIDMYFVEHAAVYPFVL